MTTRRLSHVRGGLKTELSDDEVALAYAAAPTQHHHSPAVSRETIRLVYRRLAELTLTVKHDGTWEAYPVTLSAGACPELFERGLRTVEYAITALERSGMVGTCWCPATPEWPHKFRIVWALPRYEANTFVWEGDES